MEFNGTFLAVIVTFLVFVFVMNKILYVPILYIIEERKNLIANNYKEANNNNEKTEKINTEINEKLNDAKENARVKYVETVDVYKSQHNETLAEAKEEFAKELEIAEAELKTISDEVKDGLKNAMDSLADTITEKIIGYQTGIKGFDNNKVNSVLWGKGEVK